MKVGMLCFGAVQYTIALTNALAKYAEVDFYSSRYHLDLTDSSILDVLDPKVRTHCYGDYRIRDPRNLWTYYGLCRKIRDERYDVLHIQSSAAPWMALFWRMLRSTPLVLTVHDPYQHEGLSWWDHYYNEAMQKLFVRKARKIIVHGELLKLQMRERYPRLKDSGLAILPHGDLSIMRHWVPREPPNGETGPANRTILFFGSVRANKGLEYLIQSEPVIRKRLPDCQIVIAGHCDHFERYEPWIMPDSKISVINQFIPNHEVQAYFENAAVVVLPYISATQTGIIPLAYSFGKPVVASRVGAIPEVVEEGKTGYLVEPRDPQALGEAIVKVLEDEDQYRTMSEYVKKYCEEALSWDTIAQKTIRIYEQVGKGG
ncbi:MAG: glycosyltransferase family 4 protein [bacterium]